MTATNTKCAKNGEIAESGIFNERVLMLVFDYINWDPHALCVMACVSRKLRAVARRVLWRELCALRAPNMVASLLIGGGGSIGRIGGGWQSLGKLLFFCCGCASSQHFRVNRVLPGHFVESARFSKTSGLSFLPRKCKGDVLYISDPCEHAADDDNDNDNEDDLGVYRGVFRGFEKSRTRAYLIGRQVELEERIRCPYCGTRVWSMTTAKLVPRSAARRLGSQHGTGSIEYFVCVNGHLHGSCWLVPLSSDDGDEVVDDCETMSKISLQL